MIKYLTVDQIILIHDYELSNFGGKEGILSISLLESAVYRPKTKLSGEDMYNSTFDKAACLAFAIVKNHPFIDGNKQTAAHSMLVFLELNGYRIDLEQTRFEDLVFSIEQTKIDIGNLSQILKKNSNKLYK